MEEYEQQFTEWLESLSSADREALAADGITGPLIDSRREYGIGLDEDMAQGAVNEVTPIPGADPDPERVSDAGERLAEILGWVIGPATLSTAMWSKSAARRLAALGWALNIRGMRSRQAIASDLGTTRALVSYYVRDINERWGIFVPGQKSVEARARYSAASPQGWAVRRANKLAARSVEDCEGKAD